ncbi:GNAT family N-acetyltransferase [Senegalia massiliensis]|uniref:GNAT family N-acetyltransferase n=1 Tax=Senegalia massiliensis TaxID=1720316 RepID=UPI001031E928|nr:GNAT family N-acetyltransferase [Senegalia massiliensis]
MEYNFIPMNEKYANEISYNWKYKGDYSFYNMTADKEDLEEFLDSKQWKYKFAVLNKNKELIGFYSYYFKNNIMWIGFGLKPEFTGQGYGPSFVISGIDFGVKHFNYIRDYLMLAVAKFNKRAIKTYQKIGFDIVEDYIQETNGEKYDFVKMRKNL